MDLLRMFMGRVDELAARSVYRQRERGMLAKQPQGPEHEPAEGAWTGYRLFPDLVIDVHRIITA
jgi:hypothetical protein